MIVAAGELRTGFQGFKGRAIWNRTAGTGQTDQDRTFWTGHLGPDNWDKTIETGWTGQVGLIEKLDRTDRT